MNELLYPFSDVPEFGTTIEVAKGVRWLRMPLPMALDHINLYLIEDEDGWWIVDTGMKWGKVKDYWQQIFCNELNDKPIKGVLVTHMHPDHIGQAGWLCELFRIPMYITFGEYYNARSFAKFSVDDLTWTTQEYYRAAGFDDEYFVKMKANFQGYAGIVEPIPNAFRRLEEGTVLTIGGNEWRVVIGSGHSPEHACFYCETLGVLLSGDQIIPKITSNVSVMPSEPEANPLQQWFDSLEKFSHFSQDTLVLPAHNTPFKGIQTRVAYLQDHHKDHLLALEEACIEPQSAAQLMSVLFKRKLDASQMSMAIGECIAHLNYLVFENKLERGLDHKGVHQYLSIDPTLVHRAKSGTYSASELPSQV
jgi:glyoxylase-like metal-dependent hydrolase (beta-lactamase superfamily II)